MAAGNWVHTEDHLVELGPSLLEECSTEWDDLLCSLTPPGSSPGTNWRCPSCPVSYYYPNLPTIWHWDINTHEIFFGSIFFPFTFNCKVTWLVVKLHLHLKMVLFVSVQPPLIKAWMPHQKSLFDVKYLHLKHGCLYALTPDISTCCKAWWSLRKFAPGLEIYQATKYVSFNFSTPFTYDKLGNKVIFGNKTTQVIYSHLSQSTSK